MANLSIWQIIQPTLNQNKHRVINSYKFAQEAKTWAIVKTKRKSYMT